MPKKDTASFGGSLKFEPACGHIVGVRSTKFNPDRKTVVLVHGIGVSSAYFIPFAEQLKEIYNVIALDLPGYGRSPRPPRPLKLEELTDVLYAYLQDNNLTGSVVIGHSMGCQLVAMLCKKDKLAADRAILLAPTV